MSYKEKAFVILTPGFASSESDTVCLPMQQQFVRTIAKLYPDLQIFIISFQYPYHKKTYKWFESSVLSFDGRNKGGLSRLLLRRKINAALKKINYEKQIVGLFSFWLNECAAVGKGFGKKNDILHFCWILGQDAREGNKYFKRIKPTAGELIALSDFLQDEFEKNYSVRPFYVIPPGTHGLDNIQTIKRDIDILGVGSLIPLKQYEIFIEVIAEIKKVLPSIKAQLIGDGPESVKLRNLILTKKLNENVFLSGEVPHHEVLEKMKRTKILLHPSSYEGFSGACMEALSAGAYVVSFCRAMKAPIDQWHIVDSKEEMTGRCIDLLRQPPKTYKPVVVQTMNATVQAMMGLYSEKMKN